MYAISSPPQVHISQQPASQVESDRSMYSENERLKTYKNWKNACVSPNDLARAGFYSISNKDDNVQCAFCNIQIQQWQPEDDVMNEHYRWSKHCPFLGGLRCGNIPLSLKSSLMMSQGQDTCGSSCQVRPNSFPEDSEPSNNINLSKLGVQISEPSVYPLYATKEKRENSFMEWPRSMKQTPKQLAEAGFFYNGKGDQTICFHCGGGLKDWEDTDDPWEQHAKWFSRCGFLRLQKSPEYISEVCDREVGSEGKTVGISTVASLNIKPVTVNGNANSETPKHNTETKELDPENSANRTLCKICFTNDVGVVFLPCGHIVACVDCAPALTTCAVCRKPLQATVRAFLS